VSTGVRTSTRESGETRTPGNDFGVIDLACALHIHSRHSDGGGSVSDIAEAAAAAALDVVCITDHDTLAGLDDEGWYGDVLVLAGVELSPKQRDHYLVFGVDHVPDHDGLDATAMCETVARAGGFGFAAHPFSGGSQMPLVNRFAKPQRWDDLEEPCITGIEVWNVETEGAERARDPGELYQFVRNPLAFCAEPTSAALAEWDRLGATRPVVGIAGLDAHQKSLRVGTWAISPLPYSRLFRHVRTHVQTTASFTGVVDYDRGLVFQALRSGRCYMAIDALGSASGFDFTAEGDGRYLAMGEEGPAATYTLSAELPTEAELTLLHDGRVIATCTDDHLSSEVAEPGVYRLEARVDGAVWILSNPIYLR
jgi:hypothetical protein